MIAETFMLLVSLGTNGLGDDARAGLGRVGALAGVTDPIFLPARRDVTNWQREALLHLDLDSPRALRILREPQALPRCIRLNNYWCIKSAGWKGEIASDGEGHVAFSSATEGAAVAALLLRRYYMDYRRTSAQAIVSRWAPAQCGGAVALRGIKRGTVPAAADGLATKGLRNTLRARYLSGRIKGGKGPKVAKGAARGKPSRVASRPMPMLRAPAIAIGFGEKGAGAPTRLASLTLTLVLPPQIKGGGGASCPDESARIRNYAAKAANGVAAPGDDLHLFDAAGAPTDNLAKVMTNMAAVEIGPFAVDPQVISAGIARAVSLWTPKPPPDPETDPAPAAAD